jgi:hypothetical protein
MVGQRHLDDFAQLAGGKIGRARHQLGQWSVSWSGCWWLRARISPT